MATSNFHSPSLTAAPHVTSLAQKCLTFKGQKQTDLQNEVQRTTGRKLKKEWKLCPKTGRGLMVTMLKIILQVQCHMNQFLGTCKLTSYKALDLNF